MTTLRHSLLLRPASVPTPSRDIAFARAALDSGAETVWMGDRFLGDSPARLAALAAAVPSIGLGLGLVPLRDRRADHLEETLSTLCLLAPGRISLALALPAGLSPLARPGWGDALAEATRLARRASVPVCAAVHDVPTALSAAPHVDRLVLRGVDPETVDRVRSAVAGLDAPPRIDVWLDAATGADSVRLLPAVVAERLAVPGVDGHRAARAVLRRRGPSGLLGEVERAYALGLPERAAEAVPEEFVRATTLSIADDDVAARAEEYRRAGASRLAVELHGAGEDDAADVLTRLAEATGAAPTGS